MTASDLTDAMYSYSWPLPPHQFKRRVVVAASALNMEEGEKRTVVASGLKGGREVYWALPDWMHEGHLLLNRYPVIREPQYTMAYGRDVAQKITEAPEGASNDVAKEDGRLK